MPRVRFFKVSLKWHQDNVPTMEGQMTKYGSCTLNVKASNTRMAEMLAEGTVSDGQIVDVCKARSCNLEDFDGVIDLVEEGMELPMLHKRTPRKRKPLP